MVTKAKKNVRLQLQSVQHHEHGQLEGLCASNIIKLKTCPSEPQTSSVSCFRSQKTKSNKNLFKKIFDTESNHCSTKSMVSRDVGSNKLKTVMDLNLTTKLKYLFMLMETLCRKVLNFKLVCRQTMVANYMKWLNKGVGMTNIGRFMTMFIMNRATGPGSVTVTFRARVTSKLIFLFHFPPVSVLRKNSHLKRQKIRSTLCTPCICVYVIFFNFVESFLIGFQCHQEKT